MSSPTSRSSPGSEGLTLQRSGRDSKQSGRSKRMHMHGRSLKDTGRRSTNGEMYSGSMQLTFGGKPAANAPHSLRGDFPANHSVVPGTRKAREMTVISGRRCSGLCRSSGPLGSLEKMLLGSSTWHSTMCSLTWKIRNTRRGRSVFQLAPSVHRMKGSASSLWPTPRAEERGAYQRDRGDPSRTRPTLTGAARMYPTPTAPGPHQVGRIEEWGGSGNPLRVPTPSARDYKSPGRPEWVARRDREGHSPPLNKAVGGMLNPEWVEWLIGFPIGWTACEASGMRSSRNRSTRSSKPSRKSKRVV